MTKTPRSTKRKTSSEPPKNQPPPTGKEEIVTACWVLAAFLTMLHELLALGAWWWFRFQPQLDWLRLLGGLLTFAAIVLGSAALVMMWVAKRIRKVPPPTGFTVFTWAVSGVAWLMAWVW